MIESSSGRIERPYHAWLAPLAGYAAAVILNIIMTLTLGREQPSRLLLMIMGSVPLAGWLACHIFGYTKSIQCLIGKRSPKHGIAGLVVNTLSVVFMVFITIAMILALQAARQSAASPQAAPLQTNPIQSLPEALPEQMPADAASAIQLICDDKQGILPVALSDHVTLYSVFPGQANTLHYDLRVHGIAADDITPEVLGEFSTAPGVKQELNRTFTILRGTGAVVMFKYALENGETLREYSVQP